MPTHNRESERMPFAVVILAMSLFLLLSACTTGEEKSATSPAGQTPAAQQAAPASTQGDSSSASPSSPEGSAKKVIGVVSLCGACTGEARAIEALKQAAETKGWTVQAVDGAGDLSRMISQFETFLNQGVDGLVGGAVDAAPLSEIIEKANGRGIPFILETGRWGPGVTTQVGPDPAHMGQVQGSYMVERMGGQGGVVFFTFRPAPAVAIREDVVKTILSHYEGIRVVETHNLDVARAVDDARRTMETLLLRYPKKGDISAVWCGWDDPCTGAAAAINSAGRTEIFLIGNDGGQEAMDHFRDETSAWDVTVYVDYSTVGQVIVEQFEKVFSGKGPDGRNVFIELPLLGRHNVPPAGQWPAPVGTYVMYQE